MEINARDAARQYIQNGYAVIPLQPKAKKPLLPNWPNLRLAIGDVDQYFATDSNIGLLLGSASGGLTDVDLDCAESVALADELLPHTNMIHGRETKPRSHFYYVCEGSLRNQRFEDVDGTCLVEMRGSGQQTVVPPGIHPSGDAIRWDERGLPGVADAQILLRRVKELAAAAILARHWPARGSRNKMALALAGALLRVGMGAEDASKFIWLIAQVAGDEEFQERGKAAHATERRLSEEREASGWPRLAEIVGDDVVSRVADWLEIGLETEERQIPFSPAASPPWPNPIGAAAIHGLIGSLVTEFEPHTEADPAALVLQLIVVFGNLLGRRVRIRQAADHHGNLFCVLVGSSSEGRKGTSLTFVRDLIHSADPTWHKRIPSGLSSGEGLVAAVRDPLYKLRQIVDKKTNRVTEYQDVMEDKGVEDKRLLVVEQEFASVLEMMKREGNVLSTMLRDAWDHGNLETLTKHNHTRATNAHISIIAHITTEELLSKLEALTMRNGFANRFLWVAVKRSKLLPFGGRERTINFAPALNRLKKVQEFCEENPRLTWEKDAADLWEQLYPFASKLTGPAKEVTYRAAPQILRMALIYATLDCSSQIRLEHLNAARAVWDYCEAAAKTIFGNSLGNRGAEVIYSELVNRPEGLTRTDISSLLHHHRLSVEVNRALDLLLQLDLVVCTQKPTKGRPVQRWYAKEHWVKKDKQ